MAGWAYYGGVGAEGRRVPVKVVHDCLLERSFADSWSLRLVTFDRRKLSSDIRKPRIRRAVAERRYGLWRAGIDYQECSKGKQ
jgi:hypothetical protein